LILSGFISDAVRFATLRSHSELSWSHIAVSGAEFFDSMNSKRTLWFVFAGLLASSCFASLSAAQAKPSAELRRRVSTNQFTLHSADNGEYSLSVRSSAAVQLLPIKTEWLAPPDELEEEEGMPYSSVLYAKQVTSFPIGNGEIALQFSSYDIMPAGSMLGAGGRDVFLIFNPKTQALRPGLIDLGMTKKRFRDDGCFNALMTHFLVADANGDGKLDIGVIREEIGCASGADRFNRESYVQHFVSWYLFTPEGWKKPSDDDDSEGWTDEYAELPLIGMSLSPVDFVGAFLWDTYDASRWKWPPAYTPLYRKKLLRDEKQKAAVAGMPHRRPKVRFEQPLSKPKD